MGSGAVRFAKALSNATKMPRGPEVLGAQILSAQELVRVREGRTWGGGAAGRARTIDVLPAVLALPRMPSLPRLPPRETQRRDRAANLKTVVRKHRGFESPPLLT